MQAIYIFLAIFIGLFLPIAHSLTFLIRYSLMVMLFFSFLDIQFRWNLVKREHFIILLVNVILPLLLYKLLYPLNATIALAAFVVGIAPTAAVAPVIASFLKGRVEFVTTSVLLTTPALALIMPLLLPIMMDIDDPIRVGDILRPISIVIFGPLICSQILKWLSRSWVPVILRFKRTSFYLFLFNVFIASASASHFVQHDQKTAWYILVLIGVATACLCVLLFIIGERIGKGGFPVASSLSLGRKNTMFAIWISLTFLDPVIALGPMFYIFFQNAFNGWQMWKLEQKEKKIAV